MVNTINRSDQNRIAVAIFVSQSLFSAAMIAMFTLTPIIAAELSGRDSAAGVPSTVILIGRAIAAYPLGWFMDRVGRRLGLSAGFGFGVLGAGIGIASIIMGSFVLFCVGALIVGFGRAAAEQGRFVAAEVFKEDRRARVIGFIVFAGTIGSVFGPGLVNFSTNMMNRYQIPENAGPFFITLTFTFLALAVTFLALRPDPLELSKLIDLGENKPTSSHEPPQTIRGIFSRPMVQLALAAMIIGQLVMVLLMTITPLHMANHAHTTRDISFVIMAHTLGMFGLSAFTGQLVDRFGRIPMIAFGSAILISASLMAPISTSFSNLAISLFLLGLGWNFTFVGGSSLLSDALKYGERGRIQGASEMLIALAAGTGSFSTGPVYTFREGGMAAVAAVGLAFALFLVAWLVYFRLNHQPRLAEAD
ncbi:MAG: MFS transporter [Chloroflexota bacterium]